MRDVTQLVDKMLDPIADVADTSNQISFNQSPKCVTRSILRKRRVKLGEIDDQRSAFSESTNDATHSKHDSGSEAEETSQFSERLHQHDMSKV